MRKKGGTRTQKKKKKANIGDLGHLSGEVDILTLSLRARKTLEKHLGFFRGSENQGVRDKGEERGGWLCPFGGGPLLLLVDNRASIQKRQTSGLTTETPRNAERVTKRA